MQNFRIARIIVLIMESALTIRASAKTIGEVKIVPELSVQTIAVTPVWSECNIGYSGQSCSLHKTHPEGNRYVI